MTDNQTTGAGAIPLGPEALGEMKEGPAVKIGKEQELWDALAEGRDVTPEMVIAAINEAAPSSEIARTGAQLSSHPNLTKDGSNARQPNHRKRAR